jgi:hypothetical protein
MSAAQRKLKRLIRADEERGVGSIQDSAFFKQNPQRSFRMRLATQGEIAATELIGNNEKPLALENDALWWMVIKQVAPSVGMRCQVYAPLPEAIAEEVFALAVGE